MDDDRKKKLVDLGAEPLAYALLTLAETSEEAEEQIEQLLATPKEKVRRYKRKLAGLKRSKRFYGYWEAIRFARELSLLLRSIQIGAKDAQEGLELVAAFYEADAAIFERCDDSSGCVGDLFRIDAKDLFTEFASRCPDKEKVADLILDLNRKDDYGVRDILVDHAVDCLSEPQIRRMISRLQERLENEAEKPQHNQIRCQIQSLARQIGDAGLFEKLMVAEGLPLPVAHKLEIARVYLESGEVETARSWIKKIPDDESYLLDEREQVLLEIFRRQGDGESLTELLYKRLDRYHSTDRLQELLEVIGEEKRDEIVSRELAMIRKDPKFRFADMDFLLEIGNIDEAENYLLQRAEQLDGIFYDSLLPLAQAMESLDRHLAASLVYRSLLRSILERAYTKAYPYGVRYLRKLEKLARAVGNWQSFDDHEAFNERLRMEHGRKRSFWEKYEKGKKGALAKVES